MPIFNISTSSALSNFAEKSFPLWFYNLIKTCFFSKVFKSINAEDAKLNAKTAKNKTSKFPWRFFAVLSELCGLI
jgi:hypothetical protein